MAGNFRCRAVNQFGAEFSESATLTVLGKYALHYITWIIVITNVSFVEFAPGAAFISLSFFFAQ